MRSSTLFLLTVILALASCNDALVFSEYIPIRDGKWEMDDAVHFQVSGLDSTQTYNMFINIRNDNTFPFSNLFLITELEHPDGNTMKDTLEYRMAEPTGEWLGKGMGGVKENKLWYRENVVFPMAGVYKVNILHAMRKNGDVEGLSVLEGITDVGLEIEKAPNN
ncbi:gliding motility lipoprotein GldH [Flagellimonas taeanensis]|jgi:gliding motility-associated lipoprotein GldH|uniref:Gliding motility-associated lipoprotein GldH n=1 Tax=Flagellimonas taeanensis TaxID=1005926 RepID=A0A1M6QI00_9FLAO|nr:MULTISPECIES: gliding motility lipoprotein GldH [Allomuricauda]MDC6385529.1 gliding motility lipoprotein GldH [Muricauda sp. SK9]RIV52404.1 gliding motility lipoprotein GldH [Allomuricauda taeanensis]SFB71009.1 gliding motility-associated lipoprotein GldH [Allomuricauda taeanensis]SHK19889.1 protein involved in gliding motility GldH [Allomuricauda taeanensis]